MKFFFKQILKVSAFYLEKQKSFIPKKEFFHAVVNIKIKKLCFPNQFSVKILVNIMMNVFLCSVSRAFGAHRLSGS